MATPPRLEDTLVRGYSQLAGEASTARIDIELRALDVLLAALLLVLSLPLDVRRSPPRSSSPTAARSSTAASGSAARAASSRSNKFRTLRVGAEERLGPLLGPELVARTEAEYTRVGRWLQASQLDELPQLWNVLRGDMSFVGPRPIRPRFFSELAREIPAYWQRLVVKPGLTGFAQMRRGYETSMEEKLAHDLEWIADRNVPLYLRTLDGDRRGACCCRRAGRR